MTTYWAVVTLILGTTKTVVMPFEMQIFTSREQCEAQRESITKTKLWSLPTECMEMVYQLNLDGSYTLRQAYPAEHL